MHDNPSKNGESAPLPAIEATRIDSAWTDIQATLDDALDAVRTVRERNVLLAQSLEEKSCETASLKAECNELRTRFEETTHECASTKEELERIRRAQNTPLEDQSKSIKSAMGINDLVVHARRLDRRIRFIADVLARLQARTEEIHSHYQGEIGAEASMAQEINFARDEAFAQIQRAMKGVHVQRAEREPRKSETPTKASAS